MIAQFGKRKPLKLESGTDLEENRSCDVKRYS